jgi:hypothetical protein
MKKSVLAVVAGLGLAASAYAQPVQEGVYDGGTIVGWVYSAEGTANSGLATWFPISGNVAVDGANCNVGAQPLGGSRADYEAYFSSVTPETFANELRSGGTNVLAGHLTESIEVDGRPAMRNVLTANASGQNFNFMIVSVGGADTLLTITCTVREGGFLNRVQDFYDFVDGLGVLIEAPE